MSQKGVGRSGRGSKPPLILAELKAVVDGCSTGNPVNLVGHSLGGLIARLYQHAKPEQITSLVLLRLDDDQNLSGGFVLNGKSQNNNNDSRDEIGQRQEQMSNEVDAILDQIDGRLEENAEEFVRSYAQKGGQGWSEFLTPEFFVGAAATGVISGATYDIFKESISRIVKALRQTVRPSTPSPLEEDDSFNSEYERVLKHAWDTGIRLAKQQGIEHSIDEATALHWVLFAMELQRSLGSVNLGIKRYKRIARASAADAEHLGPSRLAARIIDEWLKQHPTPRKKKSPSRRRRAAGPSAADYL